MQRLASPEVEKVRGRWRLEFLFLIFCTFIQFKAKLTQSSFNLTSIK